MFKQRISHLTAIACTFFSMAASASYITTVQTIIVCNTLGGCADSSFDIDGINSIFSQADLTLNFLDATILVSDDYYTIDDPTEASDLLSLRPGATASFLEAPLQLWLVAGAPDGLYGLGYVGFSGAWVDASYSDLSWLIAHELGHNLGLEHEDYCANLMHFYQCGTQNELRQDQIQTIQSSRFVEVSQVPLPAAAWLFGSALIGLAGIKRK